MAGKSRFRQYINDYGRIDYNRAFWDALEEISKRQDERREKLAKMPDLPDPWKTSEPKTPTTPTTPKQRSTFDKIKLGALKLAHETLVSQFPEPLQSDFRKLRIAAEAVGQGDITAEELSSALAEHDKPQPYKGFFDTFGKSLHYGTGQAFQDIGRAMQWLGKEDVGKAFAAGGQLVSAGQKVEGIDPETQQKMGAKVYLKPQYWATDFAASLPAQGPLMAAAIIPTVAGNIFGGPAGGAAGAAIGTAIARPGESFLEAGQAYEAALQMGYDKEIAKQVADKVFKENLKLSVADIPELVFTFAKIPMPLAKLGTTPLRKAMVTLGAGATKVGIDFTKEAAEEFVQENIQSKALARQPHSFTDDISRFVRPSTWTPEEASAALAGGAMGGLFGGAGVVTDVVRATMPQEAGSIEGTEGIDAIENKLVTEYGKLLNPETVNSLIELKQSMPEIEEQFGANSPQLAQAETARVAAVGQMYMDVMAQIDSYLTEVEADPELGINSDAHQQLQGMKADLEQTAPQQLLDIIQGMEQQETVSEESVPEDVSAEVVPEEAATEEVAMPEAMSAQGEVIAPETIIPQGEAATPEGMPTETIIPEEASIEDSAVDTEMVGDAVDMSEDVLPAEEAQEDIDSQEAPEDAATAPQVGKPFSVTYRGTTYTGRVVATGKANTVILTDDGRQLTIPTNAKWREVRATEKQAPKSVPETTPEQVPEVASEKAPESVPEETPGTPVTATYTINEDNNTVEVKFPSKPGREATDKLYAAGFKYSRKNKTWYAEQTPERTILAKEMAGETVEARPEEQPKKEPKKD
ncbi:MAG: hypothetical protein ACOX8T_12000, partial [Bacillota bacterium]